MLYIKVDFVFLFEKRASSKPTKRGLEFKENMNSRSYIFDAY